MFYTPHHPLRGSTPDILMGGGGGSLSMSPTGVVLCALDGRALEEEGRKGPCLIIAMERDSGVSRLQVCVSLRVALRLVTKRVDKRGYTCVCLCVCVCFTLFAPPTSCSFFPCLYCEQMAMNNRSSNGLGLTLAKYNDNRGKSIFYSEVISRSNAALAYCFDSVWDSAFKIQAV